MFSHFTVGSNDLERSARFYTATMETLGLSRHQTSPSWPMLQFGQSNGDFPHLFIVSPRDGLPATWSNGFHIAFNADSTTDVDRFHAAAMAAGGTDDGAPGLRVDYEEDYYATYVRDPDGNKLQAVCYQNGRSSGPSGELISHITIGHAHLERERQFYTAVLKHLGLFDKPEEGDETSSGFGYPDRQLPVIYVQETFDGRPATWGNGTMVALRAESRGQVDACYRAAIDHGGRCAGPPGLRSNYSPNYYGAYVRDPVGNKLHVVCRARPEQGS